MRLPIDLTGEERDKACYQRGSILVQSICHLIKGEKNDEKIGLMHVSRGTFLYLRLLRRSPGAAVEQPPVTGSDGFAGGPPGFRFFGSLSGK